LAATPAVRTPAGDALPAPQNPTLPLPGQGPSAMDVAPVAEAPLTPPDTMPVNTASTYFYDSLAPYGSWIDIQGYGLCWQPTTVVLNAGWSPYCDRGRWVYSDCGW